MRKNTHGKQLLDKSEQVTSLAGYSASRYWTQTDCDVIFPMEDYPCNNSRNRAYRESFQVVTYSTICTGHIQHNNNDIIMVEVTMTRQNFQKLLNPEINQNGGVW